VTFTVPLALKMPPTRAIRPEAVARFWASLLLVMFTVPVLLL